MYCINCGSYIQPNHRFCIKCGARVKLQNPITHHNSLTATLSNCRKYNLDTFMFRTAPHCDYCSKYGRGKSGKGKVYSISGKSKKYPSMMTIPADLTIGGTCPECGKYYSYEIFIKKI